MTGHGRYFPLSKSGFAFPPLAVREPGVPLASLSLPPELELLVFSRGSTWHALVAREMAYHHVAQGELAGEPYLISF